MEKEFTEGDAFVAAYSEYFGVVYKEALKYSGNHHIAEEIAQDAFFTAYIQCGSESKQQIRTWMLMFARYRAMNYIRDHKREVPLAEITMADDRYPNSLIDDSSEDRVVALNALEGILKRARKWMIKRYKDQYDRLHDI